MMATKPHSFFGSTIEQSQRIYLTRSGWGENCESEKLNDCWNRWQHNWHSNQNELCMGVFKSYETERIQISSSNGTDPIGLDLLQYITKQGGTESLRLLHIPYRILGTSQSTPNECLQHDIFQSGTTTPQTACRDKRTHEMDVELRSSSNDLQEVGEAESGLVRMCSVSYLPHLCKRGLQVAFYKLIQSPVVISFTSSDTTSPETPGLKILAAPEWESTFWNAQELGPRFSNLVERETQTSRNLMARFNPDNCIRPAWLRW